VPATSAGLPRVSFFFSFLFLLLQPLTVLRKQTRPAVCTAKQSIFLDVYGTNTQKTFPQNSTTQPVGIFIIIYFVGLSVSSVILLFAVFTFIRGLFFAWFAQMAVVVLFQVETSLRHLRFGEISCSVCPWHFFTLV
jgi:hypothetical protein